ncbi:SdrD B-like domain-containing protein [Enterococcus quebecensis]|uniref:SD-repeat containing protein B domain-containing protein n=1 Tax=Enterococcus quebecensis TaxID=903983 RepID=A0A1E5GX41_9ENTE|nr:SdrD B-like domain-containing protein [Enterococcus quebecensis]OEG17242.1 hypothetical protein BCR23_04365 [Enterococcus quebecensis]
MKKFKFSTVFLLLTVFLITLFFGESEMAEAISHKANGSSSISAILFEDSNMNGKQDPNELGIEGITVRLFDDSGTEIAKTVTDREGKYIFGRLASEMYQLKIDFPTGYVRVTTGAIAFSSDGLSSYFELDNGETFTDGWIGFFQI